MNKFILSKILPIITKNKCKTICDYGCGNGELLEKLQKENPNLNLLGIDYFNKYKIEIPQNTTVKYIDRGNNEFSNLQKDDKFDMIISTFALHHFQYPVSEIQLLSDLIKPNGFLIFIDFAFKNDSRSKITKNISSFIEEMGASIKGRYHRHHYTLAEAKDLLNAIPIEICEACEETNELSEDEKKENIEHKLKRNSIIQKNIKEKAPDFWKEVWIPFFEQEKKLLESNGIDYSSLFFISAKLKSKSDKKQIQ